MSFETDVFLDDMNDTLQRQRFIGYTDYGRPRVSTGYTTYRARIVWKGEKSRSDQMTEKLAAAVAYVASTERFSLEDRIYLPEEGISPKIMHVAAYPDENVEVHHIKVEFGV